MPKRKKKSSLAATVAKGIGRGAWWATTKLAKGAWWTLKGGAKGAKSTIKRQQVKAQQPKTPAAHKDFALADKRKGELENFTRRLASESLIIAIAGRRGSGKSGLGFRIMENVHAKTKRPCFVLGVKQSALPSWITEINDLKDVKNKGIVLIDEGAIAFGSRKSMSKENRSLADLLAIARHKDLTLLFITQNTGMIDKNVLNLCDTIVMKEGSLLQEKMERNVMKDLYKTANTHLSKIPIKDRKAHCYVFDADFEGVIKADLPSFWSSKVSKNQA